MANHTSAGRENPITNRRGCAASGRAGWLAPLLLIIVMGAAVVVIIRRGTSDTAPAVPSTSRGRVTPPPAATERWTTTRGTRRIGAMKHELDPRRDGWESEWLSREAGAALTALIEQMTVTDGIAVDAVPPFLADGFTCTPFRPAATAEAYRDDRTVVRRGSEASPEPLLRGAEGLAAALRDAAEPLTVHPDVRGHAEVVSVRVAGRSVRTVARVDASGRGPEGAVQWQSTWHGRWQRREQRLLLESIRVTGYEEVASLAPQGRWFTDRTPVVMANVACYREQLVHGLSHWTQHLDRTQGMDLFVRYGLAVGDVNGDELDDLYLCQGGGLPNRLLVQATDGTLRDHSASAGVDWLDSTRSALFVDLDNDGDQDLAVAMPFHLLVLENADGRGRFRLRADLPMRSDVHAISAADYDQDADLDLYVTVGHAYDDTAASDAADTLVFHDANDGAPNRLLRNAWGQSDWTFEDVTVAVGLDADNRRHSLAAAWEDYDNDGDADLYVANDYGRNCLYRNDGGRFVNVADRVGAHDYGAGMSVSWGDADRDGRLDLYVGNMFSSAGSRITTQAAFKTGIDDDLRTIYRRFARGNSLYLNGADRFDDASLPAAVAMGRWAWSSLFADVNNDGWEDLLVANGFITNERLDDLGSFMWRQVVSQGGSTIRGDPRRRHRGRTPSGRLRRWIRQGMSLGGRERNCVFLNTGGVRFADVSAVSGFDFSDDARGIALTDWDHDGDIDVWVLNRSGPQVRYLDNNTSDGQAFVALKLRGVYGNRDAVGARVEVVLAAGESERTGGVILKSVRAGDGFLSQSSKWMHVGLGQAQRVERITVHWPGPGGGSEKFENVSLNTHYRVVQGTGALEPWGRPGNVVSAALEEDATSPPPAMWRTWLVHPVEMPRLPIEPPGRGAVAVQAERRPTVVNLWASWCVPCVAELRDLAAARAALEAAGLGVVALSVDGVGEHPAASREAAARMMERLGFPHPWGFATTTLVDHLQIVHDELFDRHTPLPVPTTLLLDGSGRLQAIYKGKVGTAQLVADAALMRRDRAAQRAAAPPLVGRWHGPLRRPRRVRIAHELLDGGNLEEAEYFMTVHEAAFTSDPWYAEAVVNLGVLLRGAGEDKRAAAQFRKAVSLDTTLAPAHYNLGLIAEEQGDRTASLRHHRAAVTHAPDSAMARFKLGVSLYREGALDDAIPHLIRAAALTPDDFRHHHVLAQVLDRAGRTREALEVFARAVALDPAAHAARIGYARALMSGGRDADALEQLRDAQRYAPNDLGVRNAVAWFLATTKVSALRNAAEAVRLAEGVCEETRYGVASLVETLAAAYAAAGRWDEAVKTARRAERVAREKGETALAEKIGERRKGYERRDK